MKNILTFIILLVFSAVSKAQSPVTFTLLTPPCDSNGVLVAHYSVSPSPSVSWYGGQTKTAAPSGVWIHTTSLLTDTIFNYAGGEVLVRLTNVSGTVVLASGYYAGSQPFSFTYTNTHISDSMYSSSVTVIGGTPPYSYRWYKHWTCPCSPNNEIYGGTYSLGTSNPISLSAPYTKIYDIEVTDAAGCWSSSCLTSNWDTIWATTSSVPIQQTNNGHVSIYPNPTTTSLTISMTNEVINHVTITNMVGQLQRTYIYNNKEIEIEVADLPCGMYFIKVNETTVRKFLKE